MLTYFATAAAFLLDCFVGVGQAAQAVRLRGGVGQDAHRHRSAVRRGQRAAPVPPVRPQPPTFRELPFHSRRRKLAFQPHRQPQRLCPVMFISLIFTDHPRADTNDK